MTPIAPDEADLGANPAVQPGAAPTTILEAPAPEATQAASEPFVPPVVDGEARPVAPLRASKGRRKSVKPARKASRHGRARPARAAASWRNRLALAAALMLTAAPLAILYRIQVVTAFPRTAGLFAAVGLQVNVVGLSFEDVRSSLGRGPIGPVLEVEGRIVNLGRGSLPIPPLQVAVEDQDGTSLYTWSPEVAETEVAPGATVGFSGRLPSPPPTARRVRVTFGDGSARATLASR